ncbi:unnamed protein product [Bursaphelenchus xylophilus]|uniref:(pine wood nematode) hypothetical protein n=1 Tax=Bursaphelenchus xylophilus TaxID=6326 RepID=A0A1I7RV20_BURXY|nr:unnamed protein product [Bursaphelenchus xylophilus]CAG9105196.1 unnamed protein product [Bursaphelenchus xylophilus]
MDHFWGLVNGPEIYATLRPKAPYQPNMMERLGGMMIYTSQLTRAIGWVTSPFWLYYLIFRMEMTTSRALNWTHFIVTFHSIAYGLRTAGRLYNPTYRQYLAYYCKANDRAVGEKMLEQYDFEITPSTPAAFQAEKSRDYWYLENKVDLPGVPDHHLHHLRLIAKLCVHTFGRRMLYPGSVGILKTLLSETIRQNRLQLILDLGGKREQIKTVDGNIIDTMLFDRRGPFPEAPLIICSDGNAGFYETGIARTPVQMDFSVLGWNPPGFAESTGTPYPDQILNAMDAVIQFALSKGFQLENIILFGWSIGGFPTTWAAANYPQVRGLILDATFDDVMPLALTHMPAFAENVVKVAIREQFNLNVAVQLAKYAGPVRIIRRYNDEVITTYQGPDSIRMRRENRGNHLLAKFFQGRFPDFVTDNEDYNAVLEYVNSTPHDQRRMVRDALVSIEDKSYTEAAKEPNTQHHVLHLLSYLHFFDVPSNHTTPLSQNEFNLPIQVSLEPFDDFKRLCRERINA